MTSWWLPAFTGMGHGVVQDISSPRSTETLSVAPASGVKILISGAMPVSSGSGWRRAVFSTGGDVSGFVAASSFLAGTGSGFLGAGGGAGGSDWEVALGGGGSVLGGGCT